MKKKGLFFVILFLLSLNGNAQGINQMWGLTQAGGPDNIGLMFSTDVTGNNFQTRKQFSYINSGIMPQQTQLTEYNGKFYGMTSQGGSNSVGVIFEWDPATNIYTKKIDLNTILGNTPYGSLALYGGKFYGMTQNGGSNNLGVIFEWDPATNIYTKKFEFDVITNGYYPAGSLTLMGGKFYGMAWGGGSIGGGVIFEWDPVGNTYTIKVNLGANGNGPQGDLTYNAGKFYGMTYYGGINNRGVIFEWDPVTNIYTKKIDMSIPTGSYPKTNLTFSAGKFYGMTTAGGGGPAPGVIFEWDPATNIYTKKIDLNDVGASGATARGSLVLNGGKLYGLTQQGGNNLAGVIFEWDPATNIYTKKIDLLAATGGMPNGTLTLSGSKFYGLTGSGGASSLGTVFEWDPSTNIYSKKIDLNISNGTYPAGVLTYNAGKFYGMSRFGGGSNSGGVIFEWDASTSVYTKKIDLITTEGSAPYGSLALNGSKFYGLTEAGGTNNLGVIFEWDPATNTYTKKIDLSSTLGGNPDGNLILSAGKFYGVTRTGGSNNLGVIFEWDPSTNIYTKKIDLNTTIGSSPYGSLALNGGKFYGMTSAGGSNSAGVIFEWDPATNIYTKKIDLSVSNGSNAYGSLILNNGKFYGMTQLGGSNNLGVIFEWDASTNTYTKKYDLSTANGSKPLGSLLLNGDKFYGMTNAGGTNGYGVIFEWDPLTNSYTKKKDFTGPDGRGPSYGNDLILAPAPVGKGNLANCQALPTITIDNSNNNTWVPIVDDLGDIVAEIKANGNNLGIVNTSLFTKTGTCREDGTHRLYLNRNITITPQNQPSSGTVSVRLYILKAELDALKTAVNSQGQPSGVASINEVDVFKNADACSTTGTGSAIPLTATNGTYNNDYYFEVNINSFSSFYFANKLLNNILPVKIISFSGKQSGVINLLKWEANCNGPVDFDIERSNNGFHFETIGHLTTTAIDCTRPFEFTDYHPNLTRDYYRIKVKSQNDVSYSAILLLQGGKTESLQLNLENVLVTGALIDLQLNSANANHVNLYIADIAGRIVHHQQLNMQAGISHTYINSSNFPPGIYYLYGDGKEDRTNMIKFIKQ